MLARRHTLFAAAVIIAALYTAPALAQDGPYAPMRDVLLNDLAASTDPAINALQAALLGAATDEQANAVLEAAGPILHGGEAQAVRHINRQTFGLINQRLAMLRAAGGETNTQTGGPPRELEAWWQFHGGRATQDPGDEMSGYKATIHGLAAGLDAEIIEDGFLGLSLSWGESEADSTGPGDPNSQTDSYALGLYGDYDWGRSYANLMLSYGYNDINAVRTSAAGRRIANYHAGFLAARAEAGMNFFKGKTRIIPKMIAHYTRFSPDSFTDEGAAPLHVTAESLTSFEIGPAVDFNWLIGSREASYFVPSMRLGYRYDFAADSMHAATQFVAGGPAFELEGLDPSAHTVDFGLGITYFSQDDWELLFGYDYAWREDYSAHAGMVRASYKFMR